MMGEVSLSDAVAEHLELQRQNRDLERTMPLDRYREPTGDETLADDPPTQPVSVLERPDRDPAGWWEVQEGTPPRFDWE